MLPSFMRRCCASALSSPSLLGARLNCSLGRPLSRAFVAADAREASSSPISPVTEAFPFLSGQSAAAASRPGSFGSQAAAASEAASAAAHVQVIRDMDTFELEVYRQPPQPLAIFFSAKFNMHNKQLLEHFIAIANEMSSKVRFLVVDVDEVPRAAYHCGVEHSCTFVVQYNCDAFRKRIVDPIGTKNPQQLMGEFRAALDMCLSALQEPEPPQQQVEWYTHGIPVDNLNVYRVNWPTA